MQMKLMASAILISIISTAHAGPKPRTLYTDGDWTLTDTDKKNPNALCIAHTQFEDGRTIYRLEFAHVKSQPGPTDVQIRIDGTGAATSFHLVLKDESSLAFANAGEVGKRQFLMWNIPQHTDKIIAQLEDRKDLKLKPADGSRDRRVEFSADGFKRVKEKMSEKCLNNLPVFDQEFEQKFALKQDTINPLGITPDQVKELRRILNAAYSVHLGINGTKSDLVKLTQKFQAQLNEKQSLISRIDQLGNVDIPSIIRAQQENDALEGNSRGQLQQVNITISQQQSNLAAAQAQLNTARTVIAPYEAEHGDRSSRAYSARSAVNAGAQRLNEIDNGIRNAELRINQLSNEAGQLQNQNARLEYDRRNALQNLAQAQRDAQAFRPREEVEMRLRRNAGYQQSLRELSRLQNSLQVIRNGLNDAKGKLLARQTELRVCQTRTSFIEKNSVERIPAQVRPRPDRPNRPDGDRPDRPNRPRPDGDNTPTTPTQPTTPSTPTTPTEPTPTTPTTPAVDCTAQQNAVNAAQQVVNNLEAQERAEQAKFQDVNRDVQRIENRTREEAQNFEAELRQRVRNAEVQVSRIENEIAGNIRRVDQISRMEIPQHQNIINSLSAERPSVQARYDQDVPNANRLESELAAFERRVGWAAKRQAVENAEALVSQRSSELNRSLSQKSSLENQINRCISERTRLANQLVDTQNRKAQAEQRLTVVIQSLVPYDNEKARLEQSQADLSNQLMTMAQDFESKIP